MTNKVGAGIDDTLLEICSYDGNGYKPLIDFGTWRVAFLRYLDEIQPDRIDSMERHTETDEVFILLQGRGMIILGGNGAQVDGIYPQRMDSGKLYNVKLNGWHTILLSKDATVLLVENCDTGKHNSEYASISSQHQRTILEIATRESFL